MPDPTRFSFQFGNAPQSSPRDPAQPLRILLLSKLRGNTSDDSALGPIRSVDVDDFDDLLAKIRPSLRVQLGDSADAFVEIEIREMDDFHPDQLYRSLPVFHQLRDLRQQLQNTDTFKAAAARMSDASLQQPKLPESPAKAESDSDMMERILGKPTQTPSSDFGLTDMIKDIVAPYIVAAPDPQQDAYLKIVDTAIAAQMRTILHGEAFQALEAAWQGLYFLVSNIEIDEDLQLFVWDVSKSEIQDALDTGNGNPEDSVLVERLVKNRDSAPFSLLVSDFRFDESNRDMALLAQLGAVAAGAGAPFLATASPQLTGADAWSDASSLAEGETDGNRFWEALRSSSFAPWIGLVAPGYLLRLPYGAATDPIDAFLFEELEVDPQSTKDPFLWGAPALACATLIAASFSQNQWAMSLHDHLDIGDLPACTLKIDGVSQLKPCAETLLPERTAEAMLQAGVMPLVAFKDRNAVGLLRFQSIASGNPQGQALSGPFRV